MKIKTSELTGKTLDWAVAKCEGKLPKSYDDWKQTWPHYSTDWAQGGPIIEREDIALSHGNSGEHQDNRYSAAKLGVHPWAVTAEGPTKLIAAMRCYVVSKMGDEVDVPEELI